MSLITKIKNKAQRVAREFPDLDYKDLFQEGVALLQELQRKIPSHVENEEAWLMRAVSNRYGKMIRKAKTHRTHTVSLDPDSQELERAAFYDDGWHETHAKIEREQERAAFENKLAYADVDPDVYLVYAMLLEGSTLKEIKQILGLTKRSLNRYIAELKRLGKDM